MSLQTLKPYAVLAEKRPHGDRLRYMAGCRCRECRRANTNYEKARQKIRKAGLSNGVVSAAPAREHMRKLARVKVGTRMVAEATSISRTILMGIKSGARVNARAQTVRKILAVTIEQRGDASLVAAASTWNRVRALEEEGYTRRDIARMLGFKNWSLQFGAHRVTVRTRARVEKLYQRLMS